MCSFAVVHRPGGLKEKTAEKMRFLKEKYAAQIQLLPVSGPDISSTQVRAMAARRQDIGDVVPPAVKAYIAQEGLYLCAKPWPQVKEEIRARLKPSRYAHTLGVADTAREMALRFGEDAAAAYAAGLLHDVAKYMPMDEMRALSQTLSGEFAVDDEELASEALLHAAAGCVVARDEFGVVDEKILRAIRFHTLGGANMDALTAILYVADFVEPGRRVFDGLEEARALARTDLYAAARKCAQLTLEYVRSRHENPHPRTMQILSENIAGGDFK